MVIKLKHGELRKLPKHKMWITRVANSMTLIIEKSVKYEYMLKMMKQF